MADYVFTFPPDAAGLNVTVTDGDDQTVSTQTLGSETNASDVLVLELQLDPGNYTSTVELATAGIHNRNPAEWRFYSDRIESTGIALPEDLSGGSGVILDGESLLFEINNGATLPIAGGPFVFDTLPDGYTLNGSNGIEGFAAGLYWWSIECAFAQPAEDRLATFKVLGSQPGLNDLIGQVGPLYISAESTDYRGYTVYCSGLLRIASEGIVAFVQMEGTTAAAPDSPADWDVSYLGLNVMRIG